MRFSLAVFLLTIGAILAFAIHADNDPVDINLIGVILMVMGVVTIILQFLPPRSVDVADPEIVPFVEGHRFEDQESAVEHRRDTSHDIDD